MSANPTCGRNCKYFISGFNSNRQFRGWFCRAVTGDARKFTEEELGIDKFKTYPPKWCPLVLYREGIDEIIEKVNPW